MSNFSLNFKFKICQKFKISQPKVINSSVLGDFCLANFKFLTDLKFKIQWEIGYKFLFFSRVGQTKYEALHTIGPLNPNDVILGQVSILLLLNHL